MSQTDQNLVIEDIRSALAYLNQAEGLLLEIDLQRYEVLLKLGAASSLLQSLLLNSEHPAASSRREYFLVPCEQSRYEQQLARLHQELDGHTPGEVLPQPPDFFDRLFARWRR